MRISVLVTATAACLSGTVTGQVTGTAFGMAKGATGGGSAAPAKPTSLAQLTSWLTDSTARTIMIDRTWDYTGSEGSATSAGCEKTSCRVANGGQYYLGTLSCGGSDMTAVSSIAYDKAGATSIKVGPNKSIVGVGSAGVIKGKGLRIASPNVIIQNIHFTGINPHAVWGGDAITLQNTDNVWIDHCKFSLVGRQFIVSGWDPAGHVTISNNEFDGRTSTSATCNGQHYWALLLLGSKDWYTMYGNYFHDLSGRSPHYGTDQNSAQNVFHGINNYFYNMKGHAFDIEPSTWSVLEGNVFNAVNSPIYSPSLSRANQIYISAGGGSACASSFGRNCVDNSVTGGSGAIGSSTDSAAITRVKNDYPSGALVSAMPVSQVASWVVANAGVGKNLGTTPPSTPPTTPPSTPPPSSGVPMWGQCGGIGYTGSTTCAAGTCKYVNDWYSQCQ